MANPWQNAAGKWTFIGNWTVKGYSEMSGAMVPFSGSAKITQDGQDIILDYDVSMEMGGNKIPFPHSGKWTKFDKTSKKFSSTSNLGQMGIFEGFGRILPDCGIVVDQNPDQKTTRSVVSWSDNPNETKTMMTLLDEAGNPVSFSFMHLTRA